MTSPDAPASRVARIASATKEAAPRTEAVGPLRSLCPVMTGAASGVEATASSAFRPLTLL
jgi:hypothetical protein